MIKKHTPKERPLHNLSPLTPDANVSANLRQRAEAWLGESSFKPENASAEDLKRLVHELSVHQIELELQNEELRQARSELEARLSYIDLFDFAPVGYFTLGRDGTIRQANQTGIHILKEQPARVVGVHFGVFVAASDRPAFNDFLEQVFSNKQIHLCEVALQNEADEPLWVRMDGVTAGNGQECRVTLSDITGRKQAEADLRDGEEKYRAIFDNEIYAISIFDARTLQFLDVNEAFCRLYGYTRAELLNGKTVHNVTAEQQASVESIRRVLETGATFIPLRLQRKKDGSVFPVEIVSSPYLWKGKKVVYALLHDITTRRQMEAELLALNTRLEQRVVERTLELDQANQTLAEAQETERRALALELHDELGQVLNRVKLSLDMVPMLGKEDSQKQFEVARQLVQEMIGRVRSIMLGLRPTMLDDLGLLPALQWHFKTYSEQTGCRVNFKSHRLDQRFSPRVEIAAYRIIQEALNNVSRHAVEKTAVVEVFSDKESLHILVSDQGVGFDVQAALDRRTSTGLSGMHERARQLGGELTIGSNPGQGTRISAVLPLKPRQAL